jgi:trigger factor
MQTAVETLGDRRVRIRVEVPVADVDHAFEHALRDLSQGTKIPGFRKGKVPPNIVRARLGEEAVVDEALRTHLQSWYGRALDQERIEPVSRPEIDYEAPPAEGTPWTFTATLEVAPEATLPAELKLEAPRHEPTVDEEAVKARLERMRELATQLEPIEDAPAETGHVALIDFVATVDGKKLKDGSASDYSIELGSGRLLPGIEEALVGMTPGSETDVEVVMPDEAPKKVAGRTASFHVALKELKRRVLPELDDAFARDVSEFETLAELRTDVEAKLRERAEAAVDGEYRAAVLSALGEAAQVEIPEAMVARRIDERLEATARGMARRGIRLEQYLQATGQSLADIVRDLRPEAEASARQELALKALAVREKVVVDDAEVEAFVREEAGDEQDPDAVTRRVMETPAARESVREDLVLRKALDRAVELATPISPELAAAREKLWTPDDEAKSGQKPEIWTPGSAR